MRQILDLHIHSRYSRACSPKLTLANIESACRMKGVDIIATGDFTYPAWFESIRSELIETFSGSGLYKLKSAPDDKIKFILSTEVALVYKDEEKCRRIHLVIHAPSISAVDKLNKFLDKKYNIRSDGRPILGIKAPELVKIILDIDSRFLIGRLFFRSLFQNHFLLEWKIVLKNRQKISMLLRQGYQAIRK
jgi:PHP family Zn ribbon phosphoesterase